VGVRSPELPVNAGRAPAWSTEEVMKQLIQKFLQDESGASLIEYVLIAGIISIVGITVMTGIGTDVQGIWTNIRGGTAQGLTSSSGG
jgi:pilus assembly protein Flp/PilA